MRFINIFLVLSIFTYASNKLDLPQCIKYTEMDKVIKKDWSYASDRIKKFIEHNSTEYVEAFIELVDKPLVLKMDEEYIKEQIMHHKILLEDTNFTAVLPVPLEDIDTYTKKVNKEVKYKIYIFEHYYNTIEPVTYRMMYVYIRYLEKNSQYEQSFNIYKKIANRFWNLYKVKNKTSIYLLIDHLVVDEYIESLGHSIRSNYYSRKEKIALYKILSRFLVDKDLFKKMLQAEKNLNYKYLDMYYFDKNSSANTIINNEIIFKNLLKIVNEENLRQHLNNKKTMKLYVKKYKEKFEKILNELQRIKSEKEYDLYSAKMDDISSNLSYIELGRLFTLYIIDDMNSSMISNIFKYNLSSDQFIELSSKFNILFWKPWILGKHKFKYKRRLQKSKKFLELLIK